MANMTFGVNIIPKANANVTLGNSDNPWKIVQPVIDGSLRMSSNNGIDIGTNSVEFGYVSTADGDNAFAMGTSCRAQGDNSFGQGLNSSAIGDGSHAEGHVTRADGLYAHSEGDNTFASFRSQHALGEYNCSDPSSAESTERGTYIEIVGNGISAERSNARALDWSGNEYLKGDLYVGCGANSTNGTKVIKEGCTWGNIKGN